ncbi:S41 family peptidase [Bacteriovorax sp. Seq25_V]|uniref:S41 family peptidase n=1 Tax=Bacteriovorax sp. Seq25_V TaxID=1201288 RepID=UPI00038A2756|nr:S41 family peptidase [Bacteriovorax sp. Seq25_V]EQC48024.1 peptidase, S41 family [Bacteriovorax sp. Seq25_V]
MRNMILVALIALNVFAIDKDSFSGTKFWYMDKADRVEIVTDLYKQTKAEYALWDFKKKRIGVDGDKLFQDALAVENAISDVEGPILEARANLDFIDRVKKIIATFQDTHFGISTKVSMPWIVSGLGTKLIDDKVFITEIYQKVITKSAASSDNGDELLAIKLGDEVLAVDGVSVSEKINELVPYLDASSVAFARESAGRFLLERYFKIPSKPFFDVKIKSGEKEKVVRVPLHFSDNTQDRVRRRDAMFYMTKLGFIPLAQIRTTYDQSKHEWIDSRDLDSKSLVKEMPKGAIELNNWTSAKNGGSSIVRSGLILDAGKVTAYMQVNSFSVSTVYKGSETTDFISAIRNEVKYFKAQNLNLILDIRSNGGGRSTYPGQVLSLLTEEGKTYNGTISARRITRYMRQLFDYYSSDEIFSQVADGVNWQTTVNEVEDSISDRREYTRAIYDGDITADEEVGGYNGKIVALISPSCISACDKMSMLLKTSKRATLVGISANGTGAGYSSNDKLNTQFTDRFNVFSTQIPNYLFGYPPATGVSTTDFSLESGYELNSENVEVKADVIYEESLDADYINYSKGWIEKALSLF